MQGDIEPEPAKKGSDEVKRDEERKCAV